MSQPLHLTTAAGYRQRAWEAIRLAGLHGDTFSIAEIAAAADEDVPLVREYCAGLIAAGYIVLTEKPKRGHVARYKLARDNGAEAPRLKRDGSPLIKGLPEEQMWRVLRSPAGADISAVELAAHASSTLAPVSEAHAAEYLEQLACAKYAGRLPARRTKPGQDAPPRYRLIANTGPRPPMLARIDCLYDANLGAVVWVQPVTEETCLYGN